MSSHPFLTEPGLCHRRLQSFAWRGIFGYGVVEMWALARRILFLLPAETAHELAVLWLRLVSWWLGRTGSQRRRVASRPAALTLWGQPYANRIGLAAGFDKGAVVPAALFELGFGFVEIGTVTPRPQAGNPKPRLFRVPEHRALINRMGFNNPGAAVVRARLERVRERAGPVWLNIGKNKDTPNERAADDYVSALTTLYPVADAFVVNVSSPNTPGLRDLLGEQYLRPLLEAVLAAGRTQAERAGIAPRPVLLKLSPDLADDALPPITELAIAVGLSGLIATNTTLARPIEHPVCREAGGLSGAPLRPRATEVLARIAAVAQGRLVLVGVGGISTAEDVQQRLAAGATLVQLYTSLIYRGPGLVKVLS